MVKKKVKKAGYLKDIKRIKNKLDEVCAYRSQIYLIEIGREQLTSDIDNEVMPLIDKIIKKLEKEKMGII